MKTVALKTNFLKGWNARFAMAGELSELIAGKGIAIDTDANSIALAIVPDVAGSYANPTVTIDDTGRVVAIEDGITPGLIDPAVLQDMTELDSYSGPATAAIVIDAGQSRSAVFVRETDQDEFEGPAWITGPAGRDGVNGADGADGAQGPKGEKGDTGERGAEGPQGPRGLQGETGPRGADGTNGAEGPQGPQGPMGPTGSALVPNDYGTLDEDRVTAIRARTGNYFFLVQDGGDIRANKLVPTGISGDMSRHVIGWNGIFFTDYGPLTGAQGVPGPQGIQGPQGERGPQGVQGVQGNQGPAGQQGERGIAGQNGLQGIQGPEGPQGIQGPPGNDASRGQVVHTWTTNQRQITPEDNGALFRLNGVSSVTFSGALPADGLVDFVNIGSGVTTVNYGSGSSVKLYPGDRWRISSSYNMFLGSSPKVLLTSVTVSSTASNSLQFDVPIGAVQDFDRLQIEVEGVAPVSSATLHMNTVDTVADNSWGTAHPIAQNQNLSPAHIIATVRAGRQPITVVGTLVATTYHFSSTIHKGAAINPNRFRLIYGATPSVNIAANGATVKVFGMDRLI